MRRLNLSARKQAEYKFFVTFYVSGEGDVSTYVEIDRNNKEAAIRAGEQKLGLKHPEQAEAFLVSSPSKT